MENGGSGGDVSEYWMLQLGVGCYVGLIFSVIVWICVEIARDEQNLEDAIKSERGRKCSTSAD